MRRMADVKRSERWPGALEGRVDLVNWQQSFISDDIIGFRRLWHNVVGQTERAGEDADLDLP